MSHAHLSPFFDSKDDFAAAPPTQAHPPHLAIGPLSIPHSYQPLAGILSSDDHVSLCHGYLPPWRRSMGMTKRAVTARVRSARARERDVTACATSFPERRNISESWESISDEQAVDAIIRGYDLVQTVTSLR